MPLRPLGGGAVTSFSVGSAFPDGLALATFAQGGRATRRNRVATLAWARDDAIIPLRSGGIAYTLFFNARLEAFAGGHAAFLEVPDRFEKELRRGLLGL